MPTYYSHPLGLLAGFHASLPDPAVPELHHIGEQWASRRFSITAHTHTVWEFYLQISGRTHWGGPSHTYSLLPGGFLAVPPHILHRMHDRPQDKHHFFFATLDLAPILARLPNAAGCWQQDSIVFVPNAEMLLAPFRQLIREISLTLPHRPTGIRLAVDALVLEATRLFDTPATGPNSLVLRHPAVHQAKELIDHQPALDWRLADLARLSGISAHHLVECFTREIGISPRRYLLAVRIDRAKEALSGSDISITELALELGFCSSQHFAATFRRLTGETAQCYRAARLTSFSHRATPG